MSQRKAELGVLQKIAEAYGIVGVSERLRAAFPPTPGARGRPRGPSEVSVLRSLIVRAMRAEGSPVDAAAYRLTLPTITGRSRYTAKAAERWESDVRRLECAEGATPPPRAGDLRAAQALGEAWQPWRKVSDKFEPEYAEASSPAAETRKIQRRRIELARRAAAWHRAEGEDEQAEQLEAKVAEWSAETADAKAEKALHSRLRW